MKQFFLNLGIYLVVNMRERFHLAETTDIYLEIEQDDVGYFWLKVGSYGDTEWENHIQLDRKDLDCLKTIIDDFISVLKDYE